MSPSMLVLACALLALTAPMASAARHTLAQTVAARHLLSCNAGCSQIMSSATSFAVLAYSTVTSQGLTNLTGDLGLYPGSDVVGFPPATYSGTAYISQPPAVKAQSDATIGYNSLGSMAYNASDDISGVPLGGLTLTRGKYFFSGAAQLTGNLTLDAQDDSTSLFVIQTATTFQTAVGAQILLVNGAQPCNVFIAVGSSATLLADGIFSGTIVAYQSISVSENVTVQGSLIALGAAVTMVSNTVVAQGAC
uniref:Ice-binding protein 2 n=1 Tax=Chloromonas brevispina TaxID=201318 RepID=A0A060KV86_9CHLO|nr:ice-binding protein 2 [Chloromonas brevispina]